MSAIEKRISQKIKLPSAALNNALRHAIFDQDAFAVFLENTTGALKSNGVELDANISNKALMRLRFLVVRAHDLLVDKKMNASKFEQLLGLDVIDSNFAVMLESKTERGVERTIDAQANIYYSEQQSESNRGSNTDWSKRDAVSNTGSDHWSTTKFDGKGFLRPEERFIRAPLLDALSLGEIIAKIEARLKEIEA